MRRNLSAMNRKLAKVVQNIDATDEQLDQLSNLANKYKNKSQREIEEEMYKMMNNFSTTEKRSLIMKLQALQRMTDLLDNGQRRKIDMFIRLLSK